MQHVINRDGLTIDFSKVTRTSGEGWSGKVTLVFRDTVDQTVTKIMANFTGDDLVDFEGSPEANDPIYNFCEMMASDWTDMILDKLALQETHVIATQGDVEREADKSWAA
jgi:hypothetical protein